MVGSSAILESGPHSTTAHVDLKGVGLGYSGGEHGATKPNAKEGHHFILPHALC